MLRFLGRWLADAIGLAVPLATAICAMQAPAVTNGYAAALLQVSDDAARDIGQREEAARDYYHLPAGDEPGLLGALAEKEPANAAALARSLDHARNLRAAYDRIEAAPPLLRPPVALIDALQDWREDWRGDRMQVLRTALATHVMAIELSTAAAVYALAGLALGSLIGSMLVAMLGLRRRRGYGAMA